jgi:two-component system, NarL family, sensor histidine kinase DegS
MEFNLRNLLRMSLGNDASFGINKFARLGTWYILALSIIATVIVIGQLLIQSHLRNQIDDSRVVNVAGKQRMLSQRISKTILLLQQTDSIKRVELKSELQSSLLLWKISQDGLLHGNDSLHLPGENSERIVELFEQANRHFSPMYRSAESIAGALGENVLTPYASFDAAVKIILEEGPSFLTGMEAIVFQYDQEAREKVTWLSRLEYGLLFISLLVIVIEIFFIFRPTALHVNRTVNKLVDSEKKSKQMANEIRELYASLERSYEQIAQINQPIENPRVFAKSDRGGNVGFISAAFAGLSGIEIPQGRRLCDLFPALENANDWMDELIDIVSEGKTWQGEVKFKNAKGEECWVSLIVTPVYNEQKEIEELVMMGSDMTNRKRAELSINRKTQAEIDKRINQQKFRSVLILEGQEEERKRIAMDIHDGIGQMLTSLKYQVESIDLSREEKAIEKLKEIDTLIKQVIKEVRKVTFNLKPTVLGDYGLQAALNVFVSEMGKLIETKLVFQSEGEIERLPQKVEDNIFRITQEAINNSIKYSGAEQIVVSVRQVEHEVIIEVKDDGKGFDTRKVEERSVNIESGRGLFNMYERSEYINGQLDIQSAPGRGTLVRLAVPLRTLVKVESEA